MEDWRLLDERPGPAGHLEVVTRRYELPGGGAAEWDLVSGPDTVAVLAFTADGRVLLVRQFRPAPGAVLVELAGGGIEPGESVRHAAARELREETGHEGDLHVVGHTWATGDHTRRRWAVLALECRRVGDPTPDPAERREPVLMDVKDFRCHLRGGQLTDLDVAHLCLDHAGLL